MNRMIKTTLLCLFNALSLALVWSQSPVWPLATNPHNYDVTSPVKSEAVSWLSDLSNPSSSQISGGPLNVAHGPTNAGFDCCGNMLFYVIHTGSDLNNELKVRNPNGDEILKSGGNIIGLNGVRSDSDVQIIRVPGKCDEWFIIYLENTQPSPSITVQQNIYNTKKLLYSHISYDSGTGNLNIVGGKLNVVLTPPNLPNSTYQHGKASTSNHLYAIRRKLNYSSDAGHELPRIDRYNITASGIVYGISSATFSVPYYYQNCPGSPLELNCKGDELAYLNYDERADNNNIFIFNPTASTIPTPKIIATSNLKVKPHGSFAIPAGYPGVSTSYLITNPLFTNQAQWLTAGNIGDNAPNFGIGYLVNFNKKLSDIEFSPNGSFLYVTQGGYVNSSTNNISYVAQIDLNTYSPTNQSAVVALKVQTTMGITSASIENSGAGLTWSGATNPNFYNDHPIGRIESAVDGNLYFTKRASNRLFVLPNPNVMWAGSDLYPRDVDLSIPGETNIPTTSDVLFLPDHMDCFDYSPENVNISINAPTSEICAGGPAIQLQASPTGGTWTGSSYVTTAGQFNPAAPGSYDVYYSINGCFRSVKIIVKECPPACCELVNTHNDAGPCCSGFSTQCKVKSFKVLVTNGVIETATWNCGTLPSGYVGANDYTFTPGAGCAVNFNVCIKALTSGASAISFQITFEDGTVCTKSDGKQCPTIVPKDCCAKITSKFSMCEPDNTVKHGTFLVTNLDPSEKICKITMTHSPPTSFLHVGLKVDGVPKPSSFWDQSMIPVSGGGTINAMNTVEFSLYVNASYNGTVTITVEKCNGTKCTFPIRWKGIRSDLPPVVLKLNATKTENENVFLFAKDLEIFGNVICCPVKYISLGFSNKEEIEMNQLEFIGASSTPHPIDKSSTDLFSVSQTYVGKNNVLFEFAEPHSFTEVDSNKLLRVFLKSIKNTKSKISCTLLDEDGEIINRSFYNIETNAPNISTAVIDVEESDKFNGLYKIYPNPAQHEITLQYVLNRRENVAINLNTIDGKLIDQLIHESVSEGQHELKIDVKDLVDGIYLISFISESTTQNLPFVIKR